MKIFKDVSEQMNLVTQYYEYQWDDEKFGIDEHTWIIYVGTYHNVMREEGAQPDDPMEPQPLVGQTGLASRPVIDANHILSLIDERSTTDVQTADAETLRIVYQQIKSSG